MASEKIILEFARYFKYRNEKEFEIDDRWKKKFGDLIDSRCQELSMDEFELLLDLIKRDAADKFSNAIADEEMKIIKEFFVDRRSVLCEDKRNI